VVHRNTEGLSSSHLYLFVKNTLNELLNFVKLGFDLMFFLKFEVSFIKCSFFRGDAFIPFIDKLPSLNRKMGGPFVMPVVDKYKDMGMVVMGKVEAGEAKKGQSLLLMPNRVSDILFVCVRYQGYIGKIVCFFFSY
jgi:selenocysteine-specific translation elongation factor